MGLLHPVVEGWTGRLGPYTLKLHGAPVDLSGLTVELKLRKEGSGKYVDTVGDVTVDSDQTANKGKVYFDPDATDFKANGLESQVYLLHWKVTDGDGKVVFFPDGEPDSIEVFKA